MIYHWNIKIGTQPYGSLASQRIPKVGERVWLGPRGDTQFGWTLRRSEVRGGLFVRVESVDTFMSHIRFTR